MTALFDWIYRHPIPESRPKALRIVAGLQRPDFIYLKWSSEEVNLYSEASRTLGTSLENGQSLHEDLQRMYLNDISSDKHSTGGENSPSKVVDDRVLNHNDIMLQEQGNKERLESVRPEPSSNEVHSTDTQTSTE